MTGLVALPVIFVLAAPADAGRPRPRSCTARREAPAPRLASRSLPPPPAACTSPRGGERAREDFQLWIDAAIVKDRRDA